MYRDAEQRDFARTLRNDSSNAEKHLWRYLRAERVRGHKFRRQAAIGPYVIDFVCFDLKLIIELDGPQHQEDSAVEYDLRRTDWLASRGFRLIRFRNHELDDGIRAVLDTIEGAMELLEALHRKPPSPTLPTEGREPEE